MAQYVLPENLGRRLDELAQRKNLSRDELLESWIDEEQAKADHEEAIRLNIARKLYPLAREYWEQAGDQTRLALTDEQLDQRFWLFDQDGIPRLKEDEGTFELRPSSLLETAGWIEGGPEDLSTSVRETMKQIFSRKDTDASADAA